MGRNSILSPFLLLLGAASIVMALGAGSMGYGVDTRANDYRGVEGMRDVAARARALVDQERESPTTSGNVGQRFQMLKGTVGALMSSGVPVRDILSRGDAEAIEALLARGSTGEAVERVHAAILKLEDLPEARPQGMGNGPRRMMEMSQRPQAAYGASSTPVMSVNVNHLANRSSFGNILKLTNPAIDPDRRRLYVCGTKSTSIGVVDIDRDELIETFDLGADVACGYLVFDRGSGLLYSMEGIVGGDRIFAIDPVGKSAQQRSSLPPELAPPRREGTHRGATKTYKGLSYTDTGYPFEVGYLQDANASYGVIEITDGRGRRVDTIVHGPDALYFDIDTKTGKLYATNTGDTSISVFDLNNGNRKIKDIDVGTSVDEVLFNPGSGGLLIRNRLGGSTLFSYMPSSGKVSTVPNESTAGDQGIGLWPTKMVLDEGALYVLSHYAGRIDVLDAATNRVLRRIPLSLSYKPRTDAISTMTMDRKHKVLYAAFPELGEIAVVDARSGKWLKTIVIKDFDKTRMSPARIALAVDEKRERLFAYLSEEKVLKVYQAPSYNEETMSSVGGKSVMRISCVNNEKDILYMGNLIVDLAKLQIKGSFPKGSRVVGFDNDKDRVYLADVQTIGPRRMIEQVFEYEGTTLRKQWTMSPILSIPSSFAFDFKNNKFYVGYFEAAVVEGFDLASGSPPSASDAQPVIDRHRPSGPQDPRGRCGDGKCGPVEKEKGVCPEDCK